MPAIITDQFRRATAALFAEDVSSGPSDYYVGIGKSDPWPNENEVGTSFPAPTGSASEREEAKRNLASVVKIDPANVALVMPKMTFRPGFRYKAFDTTDPSCFYSSVAGSVTTLPCYFVSSSNVVYVCLRAGAGAVQWVPTEATFSPVTSADGYVWVKVGEVNVSSPFNTDQFVAVPIAAGTEDTAATAGMVYGFKVVSGGTGYSSVTKPTCKLVGANSNTDVDLVVTVNGSGVVTSVDFDNTTITNLDFPTGYAQASVDISGTYPGTGLKVVPIIAPFAGFGDDPVSQLPSWFVGLAADLVTDVNGDAYYVPYRQISIIKDPVVNSGATPADDATSMDALNYFVVNEASVVSYPAGAIITQVSVLTGRPSKAFFDVFKRVEVSTGVFQGRIYYHQNNDSAINLKNFKSSGVISIQNAGGGGSTNFTYSALGSAEYTKDSGEVIFLENRAPITRNSLQTEEIKVILQF